MASYSSGRSSNEAAYLLQLLLRALGSNNLADCSDLCHAPSTIGLTRAFGSGTSMVNLEGLQHADGVVLVGSNAPANHPRLMNELIRLRERGGTVIVINPVLEAGLLKFGSPAFPIRSMLGGGSAIASLFLQPIPGSDAAVFLGLQKALQERGAIDWAFVKAHSDGWQALIAQIETTPWEAITACCGLSREELEHTAARLAACRAVVFAWAMGITHHANGTSNVQAIANTAVLSGNVGRPGAGTMPIRGHSNVQGFGSMGVTVNLQEPMRRALEQLLGRPLSPVPGYDTRALIEAADDGRVDALLCLGGNLYGANPDSRQARRALGRIDTIAYLATKPNTGHFPRPRRPPDPAAAGVQPLRDAAPHHGGIGQQLGAPQRARQHPPGRRPAGERGGLPGRAGPPAARQRSDRLAAAAGSGLRARADRPHRARLRPLAEIDASRREFEVAGRVFHEPRFPTASGRAQLAVTPCRISPCPPPITSAAWPPASGAWCSA